MALQGGGNLIGRRKREKKVNFLEGIFLIENERGVGSSEGGSRGG